MKTQKELGAVHLLIEGLDKGRFIELTKGHKVWGRSYINNEISHPHRVVANRDSSSGDYEWVGLIHEDSPNYDSKLITLDELEQLLNPSPRTIEKIESDIKALQDELLELKKINVGDVVITKTNVIGFVTDVRVGLHMVGGRLYQGCRKIDPNKTVKEILGL